MGNRTLRTSMPEWASPPITVEALAAHRARLGLLCAESASICAAEFEDAGAPPVADALLEAREQVVHALDLLDSVLSLYGNPVASYALYDEVDSGDRTSVIPDDIKALSDVITLARMGLRSRKRMLDALSPKAAQWECLAALGSALRTVQKSLGAVDRALARTCGSEATFDFYAANVHVSLDVRSSYMTFHTAVKQGSSPTVRDVAERLFVVENHIAEVLGRPIAMRLRVGDRALLMMSRTRILEWQKGNAGDSIHLAEGLRLFQDVANVATMFLEVNKREELVRHDALLSREVLSWLPVNGVWPTEERRAAFDKLEKMRGRSSELDALLDAPSKVDSHQLRAVLRQTHARLAATIDLDEPTGPRVRASHPGDRSLSSATMVNFQG